MKRIAAFALLLTGCPAASTTTLPDDDDLVLDDDDASGDDDTGDDDTGDDDSAGDDDSGDDDSAEAPGTFAVWGAAEGVPATAVWNALEVDSSGIVWATSEGGLLRLDPQGGATVYGVADGLLADATVSVAADPSGDYWVGYGAAAGIEGARIRFEPALTVVEPIHFAQTMEITTLFRARRQPFGLGVGEIWFGTNEGVCVYDPGLGTYHEHGHPTHPHGGTRGLAFTSDGHVWNADQYQLSRWNYLHNGQVFGTMVEIVPTFPTTAGTAIELTDADAGPDDVVWVSSSLTGIAATVPGTPSLATPMGPPLDAPAFSVRVDADGRVWVGQEQGLVLWEPDLGQASFLDGSLLTLRVQQIAIEPDSNPRVGWLAVENALVRVQLSPSGALPTP